MTIKLVFELQVPEKEVRVHAAVLQVLLRPEIHLRQAHLPRPLQSRQEADSRRLRNPIRLLLLR